MTIRCRLLIALLMLPPLVAGCGAISALDDASQPLEIYELQTPSVQKRASGRNVELVVEEPASGGALATERIMIRPSPLQAQYFPGVRWADTTPIMLQTLMVRSLIETGAFRSVGRRPVGSAADYAVLSELTDFEAIPTGEGNTTVRVRLIFRLVRENDATVIATRAFTETEEAGGSDIGAVVRAFDSATSGLLLNAVGWIVSLATQPASG